MAREINKYIKVGGEICGALTSEGLICARLGCGGCFDFRRLKTRRVFLVPGCFQGSEFDIFEKKCANILCRFADVCVTNRI